MIRKVFHTQEKWRYRLVGPVQTTNSNAWFGTACYFWYNQDDAVFWGMTAKKRYRYYEIYSADCNCENVLDTVFNEQHYLFWLDKIEKAISFYLKKGTGGNITLKDINDFFRDKGVFDEIDGIMFQDITNNPSYYFVKEFQYKKRIQIAVYNLNIISNFAFVFEGES